MTRATRRAIVGPMGEQDTEHGYVRNYYRFPLPEDARDSVT